MKSMVGTVGLEPTTFRPPVECATRLRYAPFTIFAAFAEFAARGRTLYSRGIPTAMTENLLRRDGVKPAITPELVRALQPVRSTRIQAPGAFRARSPKDQFWS